MPFCRNAALASVCLSALTLFSTGCSLSHFNDPSTATSVLPTITGQVHGGQQPVANSIIQLYAANSTTLKGASAALLTTVVTTDSGGNFSLTGNYTCPTPTTLVYIVATGGNPGLSGTVNNTAIALISAIGTCSTLTSSTFISINELTTVASVQSLAPFMADYAHIGSDASNTTGLAGAFAGAAALVNFSSGQLVTTTSGVTSPSALLNTLADILASCVNTPGGVSGDSSNCGTLFQYAGSGTSTDTIAALIGIIRNPTQNVTQLFALAAAIVPFQPVLGTLPATFTASTLIPLPVPAGGVIVPYQIAIDMAQHVWVYDGELFNGGATAPGPITVYDNNGNLLYTIPTGTGGLHSPSQIEADKFGNVWALNDNSTLSKFSPTGTALSPAGGFTFPTAPGGLPLTTTAGNSPVAQTTMTIDPSGHVWTRSIVGCYLEFNNDGSLLSYPSAGSGADCTVSPLLISSGYAFASDGSGNIYTAGTTVAGVLKYNSAGTLLSPSAGFNDGGITIQVLASRYDRAQNQLWVPVVNQALHIIKSDGTPVTTSAGTTMPYGFVAFSDEAVDGAGNLWIGDPYHACLHEFDPSGNILTPNTSTAAGIGVSGMSDPGPMAIDAYGNIWVADFITHNLIKVPGLAAPKNYQ